MNADYFNWADGLLKWEEKVRPELFGGEAGSAAMKFRGFMLANQASQMDYEFQADKTKGYARFALAHAFPVLCQRGCFHAGTVANSWRSMLHQGFNYDHRVKSYFESGSNIEDRFIGGVLAADYPRNPHGGWKLTSYEESPGLECVATVFKGAQGVGKIIGEHQTGRHEWTVSLETNHDLNQAGVVIWEEKQRTEGGGLRTESEELSEGEKKLFEKETPGDFLAAGFSYVPLAQAPSEFIDCWDQEQRLFAKKWKGRRLHMMFGGLDGQIHFKGVGLVRYGAEPTARLDQVLASAALAGLQNADLGLRNQNVDGVVEAEREALVEVLRAAGNFSFVRTED